MHTFSNYLRSHIRETSDEELKQSSRISYHSSEISTDHRDEKSNEEHEQEENLAEEEKEILSINELLDLVFSGKKYSRLGTDGPLPQLIEVDLSPQIPSSEHFETLQKPSRESVVEVVDDIQETIKPSSNDEEGEVVLGSGDAFRKDPLTHGIIYPDIELVPHPPFLLDYYKTWPDEENEDWATSSSRTREEIKGTLSFLHLKKGLSKFSYEIYGFTTLNLSDKSLTDISLIVRLPMTFSALTHVDLSHNKLTDISALSGLTTVTHLDVSHNKLKKLLFMYPEWYWNVDEPGEEDIEGNVSRSITQLTSYGWALYGNGVSQLRWVNYSHNLVRGLEGPKHWAHYPYLSYLDLSHNHISDLRSEDRVPITGRKKANPGGGERCPEDSTRRCGLASLTILHTLNVSNNFISSVEGLNGLCVHNLILSDNSISSWEGETGRLYEDERYESIDGPSGINIRNEESAMGHGDSTTWSDLREGITIRSDSMKTLCGEEFSLEKDDISIPLELLEPLSAADDMPLPTIRVIRKRQVEGNEMIEENEGGEASENLSTAEEYPSPKTVEVLFTETDRKKEKIPIEVLYKVRKPPSGVEHSSVDISVMDASYLENIEGDYPTRRRRLQVLHFSERFSGFSDEEDDPSNTTSDSVRSPSVPAGSIRKSYDPSPRPTSHSVEWGEEASPDALSVSSMFDYEWEGYEPDDPCFAKGRRQQMEGIDRRLTGRESRSAVQEVEVLHERESTLGEGERSMQEDGDEEVTERLYEEWDDPEVRVLCSSGPEWDSGDYDGSSVEASWGGTGTKEEEEEVRMLFRTEGGSRGNVLDLVGYEDPGEDDGVVVLFTRSNGCPRALIESDVPVCKSLEVLFRRGEDLQESLVRLDRAGVEGHPEEGGESSTAVERAEVFFEVYDLVDPGTPAVVAEGFLRDAETSETTSSSESVVVESEIRATPDKTQTSLINRINANRFKTHVGIRSLKWLTELHLERNKLRSLKMLRGTYWLRSLFLQDNLIEEIGEIMYLCELHKLSYLDMTGNSVCKFKNFHQTTLFIVPSLLYLNKVRTSCLEAQRPSEIIYHKNPFFRAARVVQDLLSASELRRDNHVPWSCPELDALPYLHSPYPVMLLVGPEGSGNKELCQHLFEKMPEKVYVANVLTTKPSSPAPLRSEKENGDSRKSSGDPAECTRRRSNVTTSVTEEEFLKLLHAGAFASVSEDEGFLFGFEKCEALKAARGGDRVLVAAVDLTTALVLHLSEFYGKPRLVLVLPESVSVHEKNLRWVSRNESFFEAKQSRWLGPQTPSEGASSNGEDPASGCEARDGFNLSGALLVEQEFVRRNLQARDECLTVHHENPGVFHCGVFYDDKESALRKVMAMVEDMHSERKKCCKKGSHKSHWSKGSLPKGLEDKINARLEKELMGCVSMWE